jgi:small subunit ribosomal protein S4
MIIHKHFLVNGKVVNIPSYLLKPGDVVAVNEKSKKMDIIHDTLRRTKDNLYPWLNVNKAELSGAFNEIPAREDVPLNVNEQLVVELYSK